MLSNSASVDPSEVSKALACLATEVKRDAATEALNVEGFLAMMDEQLPVIDVRSPSEFAQGHIPGAHSVPLFSDHERSVVGTTYKHQGRELAMAQGMRYVAPKLGELVTRVREILGDGTAVGVHCWRGGMRSGAVAWFLRRHGMHATTLAGGYKAFRSWALASWGDIAMPVPRAKQRKPRPPKPVEKSALPPDAGAASSTSTVDVDQPSTTGGVPPSVVEAAQSLPGRRVCVVGGRTGVGKTRVLHALRAMGEQIIDLEGLAQHRGSAFGWVGQRWRGRTTNEAPEQPSTEHFGNLVAMAWRRANAHTSRGHRGWVFVEDEDTHIGGVTLPANL